MVAPAQYLQPTGNNTPQSLAQAPTPQVDHERKQQMRQAWKAYRGALSRPLKIAKDQPDDNVVSNRCGPVVDKGVSFLFGHVLMIEDGTTSAKKQAASSSVPATTSAAGTPKKSPAQVFLDGLWGDDDDRMTTLSQLAVNGGVCGQTFAKLIPAQGQMKYPRIVVLDPLLIRIVTAPDDCSLVLAYIIEYPTSTQVQKRQIIARVDPDHTDSTAGEYDLDDSWTIVNYERIERGAASMWTQKGPAEAWPYPFAPIFSCQNLPNPNESWGTPDLTPDLIEMNKVLNFIQSNTARIIKFHAHPKTWGKGFRAAQLATAVDDVLIIEAPDGTLQNLEMHSDLHSSLTFAANLRADMDEQSRVPAVALGRTAELPKGNISGVALQLLFQPLIEKTTQKQRLYGKFIREICRAALVLAGLLSLEEWEAYPINLKFDNLLPIDDLAAAQTAAILVSAIGVSQTTVQEQLGYDPEAEAVKTEKEGARKVVAASRGNGLPQPPASAQAPQQDAQAQQQAGMGQN